MSSRYVDPLISKEEIAQRTRTLGHQISVDFAGDEVTVIGVLNGAFMWMADLVRDIRIPVTCEFVSASSYGNSTVSSGEVQKNLSLKSSLKGKNVILLEDIIDTGLTIKELEKDLKQLGPKSFKIASLLSKPTKHQTPVTIDYLGFEIEDKFVIGYGLDFAGKYRELPFIGVYTGPV